MIKYGYFHRLGELADLLDDNIIKNTILKKPSESIANTISNMQNMDKVKFISNNVTTSKKAEIAKILKDMKMKKYIAF